MPSPADTTTSPAIQPKATTPEGIRVETLARDKLRSVLKKSVEDRREFGGVIYRTATGGIEATGPFRGYASGRVDVHQDDENRGCPSGTTPLAWYHTHPVAELYNIDQGRLVRMSFDWDAFSGADQAISDNWSLIGYVATFDGRFWRYDPPPFRIINGKPAAEFGAKGKWGPLNGTL